MASWLEDELKLRKKWGRGQAPIADSAAALLQACLDHHKSVLKHLAELDKIEGFSSPRPSNKNLFEFVSTKADFYQSILRFLELSSKTCPFCRSHAGDHNLLDLKCDNCEYGREAGKCNDPNSLFVMLSAAIDLLDLFLTWYGDPSNKVEMAETVWKQLMDLLQTFLHFCKIHNIKVDPVVCLDGNGFFLTKEAARNACTCCEYFDEDTPCDLLKPVNIHNDLLSSQNTDE